MIKKFKSFDEVSDLTSEDIFKPKVAVIGVGGAGTNAINNMIEMGLAGVKFIVVNTDSQSLEKSISPNKLQIGPKITKGLGAGSKPEIGIQAAEESINEITELLEDINLLFVTCGMGGGTGTGASQVIAKVAKDLNILTIAFVTQPFDFEGSQRLDTARLGVAELEKCTDSLVVISNQSLFNVIEEKTTILDAFKVADNILYSGVKGITDLIVSNGVVNLDFNDVRSVVENMGRAMIASAEASGENRAESAAKQAVYNQLLDTGSLRGAKKALINITGGADMTLHEVDTIVTYIKGELDDDAFISFGTIYDENMNNQLRVSVVATGLGNNGEDIFTTAQNIAYDKNKMKRKIMQHQQPSVKKTVNTLKPNDVMNIHQDVEFVMEDTDESMHIEPSVDMSRSVKVAKYVKESPAIPKKVRISPSQQFSENFTPDDDDSSNHSQNTQEYDNYEDDEEGEENDYPKHEDITTNLFNLITKKRSNNVPNGNIVNDKNSDNRLLKMKKNEKLNTRQNTIEDNKDEESFFDIPSFLRKRS